MGLPINRTCVAMRFTTRAILRITSSLSNSLPCASHPYRGFGLVVALKMRTSPAVAFIFHQTLLATSQAPAGGAAERGKSQPARRGGTLMCSKHRSQCNISQSRAREEALRD
jgi:hypothetical protein